MCTSILVVRFQGHTGRAKSTPNRLNGNSIIKLNGKIKPSNNKSKYVMLWHIAPFPQIHPNLSLVQNYGFGYGL